MKVPTSRRIRPAACLLGLLLLVIIGGVTPATTGLHVNSSPQRPPARVLRLFQVVSEPSPAGTPSPAPTPAPQPRGRADPAVAAAVYALTNEMRTNAGLTPLARNSALDGSAGSYAGVLGTNDWFAHEGPDGSTLASR